MAPAPGNARTASLTHQTMREFVQAMDDTLPGKFEITKEGIVHGTMSPAKSHELTALHIRKRLDKVPPEDLVAHIGKPDMEDEPEGIMRHPDVIVIVESDMEGEGAFAPGRLLAAVDSGLNGERQQMLKFFGRSHVRSASHLLGELPCR
jgi:hypothetical protein